MSPLVTLDVAGPVATITLDSPANRNALSNQLLEELSVHLTHTSGDPAIRAVVLTATGTVFCSGADLSTPGSVTTAPVTLVDVLEQLWQFEKPVLCVLNGAVRAGGIGLVSAADVVIAPETATFAFSEVRLGLAPAIIAVTCLRRMTSRSAAQLMLTGEIFDAAAAQHSGLVTETVPPEDVQTRANQLLADLVLGEPGAVAATKQLLRSLPMVDLQSGFALAETVSAERFASPESAEGIAAFKEKRSPRWVTKD